MLSLTLLQTFTLCCIAIVMVILCVQNLRSRRFVSVIFLLITGFTLALAALTVLERVGMETLNKPLATVACFLGYALRPLLLYFFIVLASRQFGAVEKWLLVPIGLNALVYASSLFTGVEWLEGLAFSYWVNEAGQLVHVRGALNFTSHFLALVYLIYLVYMSMGKLRGKHRYDAVSILICATFIVAAVVVEMMGWSMGVLNLTIMASVVFYYLFLLQEENRRDALTGLFDRKTFYLDLERFGHKVDGVIQIDMNGLKDLNDTYGHQAGDTALKAIGESIEKAVGKKMYIYRVGGDEFTLLSVRENQENILKSIDMIRSCVEGQGYSVSIGYACAIVAGTSVDFLIKKADEMMYRDKAEYYQRHPDINRRRRNKEPD
ncbi:MAG: diguanylate cyclase [Bacilli bacterium]|nr:diguanylate cyclase [Bacilli bacterium]